MTTRQDSEPPSLSWLAAGFIVTAAYGGWGLLDRTIAAQELRRDESGAPRDALPDVRNIIAVVGTGAAVWAVLRFMAAALGGLR